MVSDQPESSFRNASIQIHTVQVTALDDLYASRWATLKPHLPLVPPSNIPFLVPYLRTRIRRTETERDGGTDSEVLRIVAFHGAPGSCRDFFPLAKALFHETNGFVDFIVPTFPGLRWTLEHRRFWQSAEERLGLMEAFLRRVLIYDEKPIDMIIGHSAGSYAAILMALSGAAQSLCLLGPTGSHLIPTNGPYWVMSPLTRALCYPQLEEPVRRMFDVLLFLSGLNKKMEGYDAMESVFAQYATQYWIKNRSTQWNADICLKGIPRIIMYGERDKLVERRFSEVLSAELGSPSKHDHFVFEGKNEKTVRQVGQSQKLLKDNLVRVVNFRDGGHYVFKQFPLIVAKQIVQFVRMSRYRV